MSDASRRAGADRTRWGKPSVRLSAEQARQVSAREAFERRQHDEKRAGDDLVARQKWAMGLVIPAHITIALDALGLYGPEVDKACGVREPAVDLWEAGELYPSWEQIVALGVLTQEPPMYFMAPVHSLTSGYDTSMRFHLPRGVWMPLPVHRFTAAALYSARLMGVRA